MLGKLEDSCNVCIIGGTTNVADCKHFVAVANIEFRNALTREVPIP